MIVDIDIFIQSSTYNPAHTILYERICLKHPTIRPSITMKVVVTFVLVTQKHLKSSKNLLIEVEIINPRPALYVACNKWR